VEPRHVAQSLGPLYLHDFNGEPFRLRTKEFSPLDTAHVAKVRRCGWHPGVGALARAARRSGTWVWGVADVVPGPEARARDGRPGLCAAVACALRRHAPSFVCS
jgi:hypothetical protein